VVLDLKMCDVYSFGILVNEVVSEKKPFSENLTVEDLFEKIVTKKERPNIPKEYLDRSSMGNLMISCWDNDPTKRITFANILDANGLMVKIKKSIPQIHNLSERFRTKLNKKIKEGNDIEFKTFREKFESVYGKENADKALSFIKILLNITEHQQKVTKKDAECICDWLIGADPKWILEGFKGSFFFQYFFGFKNHDEIKKDETLLDRDRDTSKSLAILYWDLNKDKFCVSVRYLKNKQLKWALHELKTKTICYNDLKKEVEKEMKIQRYKDKTPTLVQSPLFDRLKKGVSTSQLYTQAAGTGNAPIYVY